VNKTYPISKFFPKSNKISVNNKIKTCINYGNTNTHVQNYEIICKDSVMSFDVGQENYE